MKTHRWISVVAGAMLLTAVLNCGVAAQCSTEVKTSLLIYKTYGWLRWRASSIRYEQWGIPSGVAGAEAAADAAFEKWDALIEDVDIDTQIGAPNPLQYYIINYLSFPRFDGHPVKSILLAWRCSGEQQT